MRASGDARFTPAPFIGRNRPGLSGNHSPAIAGNHASRSIVGSAASCGTPAALAAVGLEPSMSRAGNPDDNAVMGSFMATCNVSVSAWPVTTPRVRKRPPISSPLPTPIHQPAADAHPPPDSRVMVIGVVEWDGRIDWTARPFLSAVQGIPDRRGQSWARLSEKTDRAPRKAGALSYSTPSTNSHIKVLQGSRCRCLPSWSDRLRLWR